MSWSSVYLYVDWCKVLRLWRWNRRFEERLSNESLSYFTLTSTNVKFGWSRNVVWTVYTKVTFVDTYFSLSFFYCQQLKGDLSYPIWCCFCNSKSSSFFSRTWWTRFRKGEPLPSTSGLPVNTRLSRPFDSYRTLLFLFFYVFVLNERKPFITESDDSLKWSSHWCQFH